MTNEYSITIKELNYQGLETGNTYKEWLFSDSIPTIYTAAIALGVSPSNIVNIEEIKKCLNSY